MIRFHIKLVAAALFCALVVRPVVAGTSSTAFTYQGELRQSGAPANGTFDFQFTLWDAESGGSQIASEVVLDDVPVMNGLFAVEVDFGAAPFVDGPRWLRIRVDGQVLTPRQPITAAPFSIQTRGIIVNDEGWVGVGTTPALPFHVVDDGLFTARFENSSTVAAVAEFRNTTSATTWEYGVSGTAQPFGADAGSMYIFKQGLTTPSLLIEPNGDVGIGTSSPGRRLDVKDNSGNGAMWVQTTAGVALTVRSDDAANDGAILALASATAGPTTYGVKSECANPGGLDFWANGAGINFGGSSSIRWKRNITPIDDALGMLEELRGVYFDWDAEHGGHHDVGMIAEEVGAVLPEIVSYEANGVDAIGMDYSKVTPLLVEAMKALRAEKDAEIAALQQQVERLTAAVEALLQERAAEAE